jgi:hypothetical protein
MFDPFFDEPRFIVTPHGRTVLDDLRGGPSGATQAFGRLLHDAIVERLEDEEVDEPDYLLSDPMSHNELFCYEQAHRNGVIDKDEYRKVLVAHAAYYGIDLEEEAA